MMINLKIDKKMEKGVKELARQSGIKTEELVTDLFMLGIQAFIIATKISMKKFKKGGANRDNISSKINR